MGQQVVAAQDGRHLLLEQGRQVLLQTLREKVVTARQVKDKMILYNNALAC